MDSPIQQPTPSAQSVQGTGSPTVERLEQSAARMSMRDDVEGEIYRLLQQQKRRDSNKRSSGRPSPVGSMKADAYSTMSRQRSASSYKSRSSSRWGGYSPTGLVTSPQHPPRSQEASFNAQTPRDTIQSIAENEVSPRKSHQASESDHTFSFAGLDFTKPPTPPLSSMPMFVHREPFRHLSNGEQNTDNTAQNGRNSFDSYYTEDNQQSLAPPMYYRDLQRNASNASRSTLQRDGSVFRDFDGVHYTSVAGSREPSIRQPSLRQPSSRTRSVHEPSIHEAQQSQHEHRISNSSEIAQDLGINFDRPESIQEQQHAQAEEELVQERVDIMPASQRESQWIEPPPAEGMVYYPAPVPRKLNMPERLSQTPSAALYNKRRSQVVSQMPASARQSAIWLAGVTAQDGNPHAVEEPAAAEHRPSNSRQSINVKKLPPQLRATMFFDQQAVPHDIKIKDGSAEKTLESLLDASTQAPVDATFDDHQRIANPEAISQAGSHQRAKSSAGTSLLELNFGGRKSRSSILTSRNTSVEKLDQIKDPQEAQEDEGFLDADTRSRLSFAFSHNGETGSRDERDEKHAGDNEEAEGGEEEDNAEDDFVVPTTLLAELQMRKEKLKLRNRTAATAFPNGMHSTLLELDAVAQVEKRRRREQRPALAWEDPSAGGLKPEGDDDEVPLGILFPNKSGARARTGPSDWDRPLGLLEKRAMEENEPLSKRRNRLRGNDSNKPQHVEMQQEQEAGGQEAEGESEHESETLAQRTRRLKASKALDDAVKTKDGKSTSQDFSNELMSQFGGLGEDTKEDDRDATEKALQSEVLREETLGQRRRRLQAEASVEPKESGAQPARTTQTLASLLAANPISHMGEIAQEIGSAGLLGQNEQGRTLKRNHLSQQNLLGSAGMLTGTLVDAPATQNQDKSAGLLGVNEQSQESKRQQLQDQNHRSTVNQLENPLVEPNGAAKDASAVAGLLGDSVESQAERHRQISQHNHGESRPKPQPLVGPQPELRPSKSFMGGMYNDGAGGQGQPRTSSYNQPMQTPTVYNSPGLQKKASYMGGTMFAEPPELRKKKSFMGGLYNDGAGGVGRSGTPTTPPTQPQRSFQSTPAVNYGVDNVVPQQVYQPNQAMYQQPHVGPHGLMQQNAQQNQYYPPPSMAIQDMDMVTMSPKQRQTIENWRQSVMH